MQVSLQLWSSGRADISTKNFDGDRPIVFQFGSPILEFMPPADEPAYLGEFEREGDRRLLFRPAPISGGRVFTADVVIAEPVAYHVRHPLIDVEVTESRIPAERIRTTSGIRRLGRNGMFWGVVQLVLSFSLLILIYPVSQTDIGWATSLSVLYTFLLVGGVSTIVVTTVTRLVRWLTARARQRRNEQQPATTEAPSLRE